MMGMGTPKMDGSVQPKSLLVHHEGETRDKASAHTQDRAPHNMSLQQHCAFYLLLRFYKVRDAVKQCFLTSSSFKTGERRWIHCFIIFTDFFNIRCAVICLSWTLIPSVMGLTSGAGSGLAVPHELPWWSAAHPALLVSTQEWCRIWKIWLTLYFLLWGK